MKILVSWLNTYGDFADIDDDESIAALADTMTSLGIEVASVERVGQTVDGVVTARVLRTQSHPDAAKVQRVWVDAGDGVERHVWCGASNFAPGDVVPLATLGTTMPNGMTIERRGILGIDSEGMLCAADELGLGEDHSGIMLLAPDTELGLPYGDVLGIQPDVLIDFDTTRNRPEIWGYVGVARDVAARMGIEFRPPSPRPTTPQPNGAEVAEGEDRSAPVTIVDGDRCGRFTSTVIGGVTVGPSASWMQQRLLAAGMRPINNVVDVSNYVMLELSQPNHAYDLDTLGGGGFRVRNARDGETLTTLDGEHRTLTAADCLICDADDTPIGIGGVMGGLDTEITESTATVALEVAWFDAQSIMETSQRMGLRSEASARYERGCDPYIIDTAIARFAELLSETCPKLVVHPGTEDARGESLPPADRTTEARLWNVNRLLNASFDAADLPALLDPIGFTVSDATPGSEVVAVRLPSWRPDSTSEVDVIEEIGRIYGYDKVGKRLPTSKVHGGLTTFQMRRRLLREVLLGLGISEAMPNPFLAPDTLAKAGLSGPAITITNPLVVEESVLRTSLRPGMLETIAFNESHRTAGARLFEIGHVYPPGQGSLPDEYEALCVLLAGAEAPEAVAIWTEISDALGVGARIDQNQVPDGLHAARSATLVGGKEPLGHIGEVDPGVLAAFGVNERVAIVELHLTEILGRTPKPAQWKPVSRYPSSDLDLAFILDDTVPADKLAKAIRQGAQTTLVDLELADIYRGEGVGEGRRSLMFRLRLQAPDRNLTDADVADALDGAVAAASKLGAELRGKPNTKARPS